eukprot:TRINITY_DN2044_c0_g1_i4.p1 TRINITY_DN2044_c0_g1~~TRINITY_DN2044_c0_g1_i4.p1  ORF type:complete len:114 (-),score=24.57 TRINITY_DN2044_c0_g1_i4:92-433(-)
MEVTDRQRGEWNCNHSCEPNVWFIGQDVIAARRDIKKGEELYYDYATSESNDFMRLTCMCGEATCRREISGKDYRLPAVQERYRGHFMPYLQRKIEREAAAAANADADATASI